MRGLLVWWSSVLHTLPADSLMNDSSRRMTASKVSSAVHPGCVVSLPSLKLWMNSSHLAYLMESERERETNTVDFSYRQMYTASIKGIKSSERH